MPRLPTHGKWLKNKAPDRGKIRCRAMIVRFSEEEWALLERAAALDEVPKASMARSGAMAEVIRRLRRAGIPHPHTPEPVP